MVGKRVPGSVNLEPLVVVCRSIPRNPGTGLAAALALALVLIESSLYLPLGLVGLWKPGLELSIARLADAGGLPSAALHNP